MVFGYSHLPVHSFILNGKGLFIIAYITFQHNVFLAHIISVIFYFLVHFMLVSILQLLELTSLIKALFVQEDNASLTKQAIEQKSD